MGDNDKTAELLSAYLDGELSGAELAEFERTLRSSPALESELRSLRSVHEQVGAHLRKTINEQKLDLWSAIESQLEPKRPGHTLSRKLEGSVGERLAAFLGRLARPRLDYRFAAGFGVLMFAFGLATSQWVDLPGSSGSRSELASVNLDRAVEADTRGTPPVYVPLLPDNLGGVSGSSGFSGNVSFVSGGAERPSFGFSPQFVRPPTLDAEHLSRSAGYRASGIDIHWVQSPKGLRLIKPAKREFAPVLWVGAQ